MNRPKKGLFIGLLLALEALIVLGLFFLWLVPFLGHRTLGRDFSVIMGWVLGVLLVISTVGILTLVWIIARGREVRGARKLRGVLIRFFLPVVTGLGALFGVSRDDIRRSFVDINNELVRSGAFRSLPKRILVLMPHCIQRDDCPHRITVNVSNCRKCGRCDFSELTGIADRFGVEMTVATGGTLARRVIVQTRPELIVAVACERDLSSGIVETYPIPVLGVLIDRPEGPCLNTRVNVENVQDALESFLLREGLFRERESAKPAAP